MMTVIQIIYDLYHYMINLQYFALYDDCFLCKTHYILPKNGHILCKNILCSKNIFPGKKHFAHQSQREKGTQAL